MQTDIVVIGTGQAGVPLATRLVKEGRRVVVMERGQPGGTCVNTGCTPTKTLLASAHAAHAARTAARLGVHVDGVRVNFAEVMRRKDENVQKWRSGVEKRLSDAGERLTLVRGQARFVGPRTVEVNGTRHQASQVIVDVGARAIEPELPGLADVPWLDYHRVQQLSALPSHLLVLGGGYVGCEFAQMFLRFGARVTLVGHGAHLLDREDPDISEALEGSFRDEGMQLRLGSQATRVEKSAQGVKLWLEDGTQVEGSHLLVATGRRPNTDDLGCDAAGIGLDRKGFILVDDHYRTTVPGVFAVGDCVPQPQFTHVAWDDYRLLLHVLLSKPSTDRTQRHIPSTVFTEPQVATVGLREHEAKARGIAYDLAKVPVSSTARAREAETLPGLIKVLIDPKTDRVLGAAIVGAEAGELLHTFIVMMEANVSVRALVEMQCVHPAYAEGLQSAVMTLPRFQP